MQKCCLVQAWTELKPRRWGEYSRLTHVDRWNTHLHAHEHTPNLTFCVYCRHVAPAVSLDNIHHGSGLLHIWWHHSHEIFIQALLAGRCTLRTLSVAFPGVFVCRFSSYTTNLHTYIFTLFTTKSLRLVHKFCNFWKPYETLCEQNAARCCIMPTQQLRVCSF